MADGEQSPRPVFDRAAFEREVIQLRGKLASFASRVTGNQTQAADLAHDVIEKTLRQWQSYDATKSVLTTWTFRIMRNLIIDTQRRKAVQDKWRQIRRVDQEAIGASQHTSIELEVDVRRDFIRLVPHVLALPTTQRDAVIAQHYLGISHLDIVAIFSCPLGTAKGWVREGMRKVRAAADSGARTSLDLTLVEKAIRRVPSEDPYYPIANALYSICTTLREYSAC